MYGIVDQIIAALVGSLVGVGIMGTADHFTLNRGLWPMPVCAHCGKGSSAQAWIPLLGMFRTHWKCGACGGVGAWRVALAVQIVAAVLAVLLLRTYGVGWILGSAVVEITMLTTVAVIDLQHRLIPTLLVYPTIVFAVACSAFWPNLGIWNSLLGGGLAFALFFGLALIARLLFGEGALGDGDVTLATLIG